MGLSIFKPYLYLLSIPPFSDPNLRLELGIQPGFLLDARYADRGSKYDIQWETRNLDVAILLGGAYHFNPVWSVDLSFSFGLLDHSLRRWTGDRYFNRAIQIGGVYSFN